MVNEVVSSRFKLVLSSINTELQVVAFKGSEALDQPYFIQVQLVSEDPFLDLEALLHQPVYLAFGEAGQGLHGQIYAIGRDDPGTRLTPLSPDAGPTPGIPGPSLRPAGFSAVQRTADHCRGPRTPRYLCRRLHV